MKQIKALLTTIVLLTSIATAQNYSVGFNYMDGYASSDASSETIFQGVTSFSVEAWYKNPGIVSGPNSGLTQWGSILTNYRRLSGGDPYNNFHLRMSSNASDEPNSPGVVSFLGAVSNDQLDDDQWHHIAGIYDHSVGESYLFIDGVLNDSYTLSDDFLSSSNKLYINNWAPFAGEFHYDCDIASVRITNGVRYSSAFTPEFPLASESNSIIALDFTTGSGTTLSDLSGNGNNFTLYDGAAWGTDVPTVTTTPSNTHSLSFDGVDDYLLSNSSVGYLSAFTLEAWIKWTGGSGNWRTIIARASTGTQRNYQLQLAGSNRVSVVFTDSESSYHGITSSDSLHMNKWYHVAGSFDGTTGYSICVDAICDTVTASTIYVPQDVGNNVAVGRLGDSEYEYFTGYIDEVRIWDTALTQTEIQAYMTTSPTGNETGLIGYWNFNEGSGTTASDATSNSNDGTIYGATWSTDVPFTGSTTTSDLTWNVQAKVTQGSYSDNDNYLGVADGATNGFDASLEEVEPPASPGSSVSLYFPHEEWNYSLGDNFSKDVRPEVAQTDTMQVWDFEVTATDDGDATLTFVFTDVPSVPVILENTATGTRQTLSNNATYTFTAVADSAHPFRISIGDTTAPTLSLGASCNGPAILNSDSTQALSWTTADGFTVDSIEVWFSSDSGTTYNEVTSIAGTNSYNWTVPDTTIIYNGMLKIKSTDYAGNTTEKLSDYIFAVVGDSISAPISSGWNLWSAPIDPANDTMTVNLNDDFTDYWVTYDYVNNGYTYDGILKETEGYWLGTVQNATIDVKGTALTSNQTMNLSQGWDLVSNPLVLDVSVDSLLFTKDGTTNIYADAVTAGWVNSVYGYSGSGYEAATTFQPWKGYWLGVLETDVSMTFPIHKAPSSRSGGSRDNGWSIAFDAQATNSSDETLTIGVDEIATDGFDSEFDAVTPPTPPGPEYVSAYVSHPEWNYLLGDNFSKDIQGEIPANSYNEWIVTLETTEDNVEINWSLNNIPDELEIGIDTDNDGLFDDMRNLSTITLENSQSVVVRVGSGVLGINDEIVPINLALHQNYPNPFNPTTTLRYDLPEDAQVKIMIYDLMGRSVKSLVNSQQNAGFKSIIWDATNDLGQPVSAGMYLYRISAGNYNSVKKMVLLK